MSVWTQIDGVVSIYKKDKVSVKEVIYDTLTDESVMSIDTEEFSDRYRHNISGSVCLDGDEFIAYYKDFVKKLKPIPGTLDIECTIRFIN